MNIYEKAVGFVTKAFEAHGKLSFHLATQEEIDGYAKRAYGPKFFGSTVSFYIRANETGPVVVVGPRAYQTPETLVEALAHELTHYKQDIEGRLTGGGSKSFAAYASNPLEIEARDTARKVLEDWNASVSI